MPHVTLKSSGFLRFLRRSLTRWVVLVGTTGVCGGALGLSAQAQEPTASTQTPASASVESDGPGIPTGDLHRLADHTFLPSSAVPLPFATSTAQLAFGFAYGSFDNLVASEREPVKLGAFNPRLTGTIRLFDPLTVGFGINATVIAGMNSFSVLQYGSSVIYSMRLGALYELMRHRAQVLSLALDVDRPHRYSASPVEAAAEVVRDVLGRGSADFVSEANGTIWRPGFRYARALSQVFGVQALVGLRFLTSTEDDATTVNRSRLTLGLTVDADLNPWISVPVGLTGSYARGQILSASGTSSDQWSVGIFETLSRSFNAGLEIGHISAGGSGSTTAVVALRAYYD